MKKIKYLGLDISTSIVGICLLDSDKDLVDLLSINLKKIKCIFSKSNAVRDEFTKIKNKYSFTEDFKISIEESFQSFSKGFSSAKTLSQLNRFNGIVSYLSADVFSVIPTYINVNSARKNLEIKINKKLDVSTKEQVFQWVKNSLKDDFDWPMKTLKSGPNKGLVKFDESCYDMSDAYVICKALIYNEEQNNL
tara:strand:- start:104 stop:682 length:579 start_codon:yes stop_codon:yes gene_type:complete